MSGLAPDSRLLDITGAALVLGSGKIKVLAGELATHPSIRLGLSSGRSWVVWQGHSLIEARAALLGFKGMVIVQMDPAHLLNSLADWRKRGNKGILELCADARSPDGCAVLLDSAETPIRPPPRR